MNPIRWLLQFFRRKSAGQDAKVPLSSGDEELVSAVGAFIDARFGSNANTKIFHERVSPLVHVDLWFVPPGDEHPWITVMTSGMAERPLAKHPQFQWDARPELVLALPSDWPMDPQSIQREANWWPMRLLKEVARYPHMVDLPVGPGHTLEAPALKGNAMGFAAVILAPPSVLGPARPRFRVRTDAVEYLAVVPIFADELALAQREGSAALFRRLKGIPVPELITARRSVVQ